MFKTKKQKGLFAVGSAMALLIALIAMQTAGTFAAIGDRDGNDYVYDYTAQPNSWPTVAVGETYRDGPWTFSSNAYDWVSADPSKMKVNKSPAREGTDGSATAIIGASAGVATLSLGTKTGVSSPISFQIVNNDGIQQVRIRDKSVGFIPEIGGTTKIQAKAYTDYAAREEYTGEIVWNPVNTDAISVDGDVVTAKVAKGTSMLTAQITDKWGNNHQLAYFVVIGENLVNTTFAKLQLKYDGYSKLNPDDYINWDETDMEDALAYALEILEKGYDAQQSELEEAIRRLDEAFASLLSEQIYVYNSGQLADAKGDLSWKTIPVDNKFYGVGYMILSDSGITQYGVQMPQNGYLARVPSVIKYDEDYQIEKRVPIIPDKAYTQTYYSSDFELYDIIELSDGNILVVGSTHSNVSNMEITVNNGSYDIYWIKFDIDLNFISSGTFGGPLYERSDLDDMMIFSNDSVIATEDGGFILSGYLDNYYEYNNGTVTGMDDFWGITEQDVRDMFTETDNNYYYLDLESPFLVKINSDGTVGWKDLLLPDNFDDWDTTESNSYYSNNNEYFSLELLPDGKFAVAGTIGFNNLSRNYKMNKSQNGYREGLVAVYDVATGAIEWSRSFGGTTNDDVQVFDLTRTADGFFINGVASFASTDLTHNWTVFSGGGSFAQEFGGVAFVVEFDLEGNNIRTVSLDPIDEEENEVVYPLNYAHYKDGYIATSLRISNDSFQYYWAYEDLYKTNIMRFDSDFNLQYKLTIKGDLLPGVPEQPVFSGSYYDIRNYIRYGITMSTAIHVLPDGSFLTTGPIMANTTAYAHNVTMFPEGSLIWNPVENKYYDNYIFDNNMQNGFYRFQGFR